MVTWFTFFKFMHVVGVILWTGGIATLTVVYARLSRTQEPDVLAALTQAANRAGGMLVGPAAVLTLLAGIATAASVGYDFGSLWITWGFSAIIASIALGATLIRRTTNAISTLATAAELDMIRLSAWQRRLTLLNLLNLLILFSAVWVMVFKPT